jgi:hypothetical protein
MAGTGKRRNRGKKATADRWERWQLVSSVLRIVEIALEWLDRGGGGPGRLL